MKIYYCETMVSSYLQHLAHRPLSKHSKHLGLEPPHYTSARTSAVRYIISKIPSFGRIDLDKAQGVPGS